MELAAAPPIVPNFRQAAGSAATLPVITYPGCSRVATQLSGARSMLRLLFTMLMAALEALQRSRAVGTRVTRLGLGHRSSSAGHPR